MRIIDLFCGAGGAAMGLHKAFPEASIVGIDINPQKDYPLAFVQYDAMTFPIENADFVWALRRWLPYQTQTPYTDSRSLCFLEYLMERNFLMSDYQGLVTELRSARTAWHQDFGVPISAQYARFLEAIGKVEDALAEVIARNVQPSPELQSELLLASHRDGDGNLVLYLYEAQEVVKRAMGTKDE